MQAMDALAPLITKWTLAAAAGVIYHALNRFELLGDASDPRIDPLQSVIVGLLVLAACMLVEWSLRHRGFLPHLVLKPDFSSGTGGVEMESMAYLPSSWHE